MTDMESPGVDFSTAATSLLLQQSPPPLAVPPLLLPEEVDSLDIAVAVKKKRRPYRHRKFGCTVAEQIMRAVAATKERRGLSVAAVKKLLSASGYDLPRHNMRVNRAVRTLVSKGSLVQTTGSGASGSVRLGRCPQEAGGAAAFKLPLGAAARRTVLAKRPAAKKSKMARGGGGCCNRRRHSQLKKAGRHHKKAGGGALKKVTARSTARWKTVRARRALVKGRNFRRRAKKVAAKMDRDSVKPTDLVDEKATFSQNTEPNKC